MQGSEADERANSRKTGKGQVQQGRVGLRKRGDGDKRNSEHSDSTVDIPLRTMQNGHETKEETEHTDTDEQMEQTHEHSESATAPMNRNSNSSSQQQQQQQQTATAKRRRS